MSFPVTALILAAGKGVRMKSDLPKVMHPVLGRPMVQYVVEAVRRVGADPVHVVVGFGRDHLIRALTPLGVGFVDQTEQLGTGHAVQCFARAHPTPPERLLIVCGDTPLLSAETLQAMVDLHRRERPALTMMTLTMTNPGSYGRIIRNERGEVVAIREAKDCTEAERQVREVNLAIYLFEGAPLYERLFRLSNQNKQGEYYLTDLVELLARDGHRILTVAERDEASTLGINSRADLALVARLLADRLLAQHMANGVSVLDPRQTWIEPDVTIGPDTVIWPGSVLTGRTAIGRRCTIGPHAVLHDATLGDGVTAACCRLVGVSVPDGTTVPPFTARPEGPR